MAGKNEIDIKVGLQGADETKKGIGQMAEMMARFGIEVDQTGKVVRQSGEEVEKSTVKMGEGFTSLIGKIAGAFGITASFAGLIAIGKEVIQFFDSVKTGADALVERFDAVRRGMTGIFEATKSFSERSRQKTTKEMIGLSKEFGVEQSLTNAISAQYVESFKDVMTPDEFATGRGAMLGTGSRLGEARSTKLIELMKAYEINTAAEQATFTRQIYEVNEKYKIPKEGVMDILGRLQPQAKAMGWKPEDIMAKAGTIAEGLTGRQLLSLPLETLEAVSKVPEKEALKALRISGRPGQIAADTVWNKFVEKVKSLPPDQTKKLAEDVYGPGAALGALKLVGYNPERAAELRKLAGPEAVEKTKQEEAERMAGAEEQTIQSKATISEMEVDRLDSERAAKLVRDIGEAERARQKASSEKRNNIFAPTEAAKAWWTEVFAGGTEAEAEEFAKQKYLNDLPYYNADGTVNDRKKAEKKWEKMGYQEKLKELNRPNDTAEFIKRYNKSQGFDETGRPLPVPPVSDNFNPTNFSSQAYHNNSINIYHNYNRGAFPPEQNGEKIIPSVFD